MLWIIQSPRTQFFLAITYVWQDVSVYVCLFVCACRFNRSHIGQPTSFKLWHKNIEKSSLLRNVIYKFQSSSGQAQRYGKQPERQTGIQTNLATFG